METILTAIIKLENNNEFYIYKSGEQTIIRINGVADCSIGLMLNIVKESSVQSVQYTKLDYTKVTNGYNLCISHALNEHMNRDIGFYRYIDELNEDKKYYENLIAQTEKEVKNLLCLK